MTALQTEEGADDERQRLAAETPKLNKMEQTPKRIWSISVLILLIALSLCLTGCDDEGLNCNGPLVNEGSGLEKGRCYEGCKTDGVYTGDIECNLRFPGEKGGCKFGEVCTNRCQCKIIDADMDGYVDKNANIQDYLNPLFEGSQTIRYFVKGKDCDDANSNIHPGAKEICNGLDDNCDGEIDENAVCAKTVYLCKKAQKEPLPAAAEFSCDGGEWCHSEAQPDTIAGFGDAVSCSIDATPANLPENYVAGTEMTIYAYYCDKGSKCFKFNEKNFKVCAEMEIKCDDGIDNDCNGYIDRGTESSPADPACKGECNENECNIEEKKWCDSSLHWIEPGVNYCTSAVCGRKDPACLLEGTTCATEACDYASRMVCTSSGYWTKDEAMYCMKCGKSDSTCQGICTTGSCDTVKDKTCYMGEWHDDGYGPGGSIVSYCESTCGKLDAECPGPCTPGACDTEQKKYCKADGTGWTDEDYCASAHCGKTAAVCGTTGCDTGACAIYQSKAMKCINNQWVEMTRDTFCPSCMDTNEKTRAFCFASCPAVPTINETGLCNDNLDNDCDGKTDCSDTADCPPTLPECAAPPCSPSDAPQACDAPGTSGLSYDNPDTENVESYCKQGTQSCGSNGRWGQCTGYIAPATEICNSIDDDCDASIDEGCECTDGTKQICGQSVGACRAGIQECKEGRWDTCYGQTYASSSFEKCDGIDNDCDGKTDEGCRCEAGATQECGSGVGMCKKGNQTCVNSQWGDCVGEVKPLKEICDDGKDNDCDGLPDALDDECKDTNQCCKISCGGRALNRPECSCCKATCFDQVKNQGEEKTDCGGPCEACNKATCNDRQMNGDEEGLDCGGDCPPCQGGRQASTAPGTGIKEEGPEEEITEEPICGDEICDAESGEDEETCPEDCDDGSSPLGKIIPIAIILIVLIGGFAAYKAGLIKMKPKGAGQAPKSPFGVQQRGPVIPQGGGMPPKLSVPSFTQAKATTPMRKQKEFKSKEEEALEKLMKEQQEMLKK